MILLIGGIKGGSGKSTIATNLAVMRSLAGKDVLLVDADDQQTSSDFTNLRNEKRQDDAGYTCIKLAGSALRSEIKRLKSKYDDIVIDTGGRDTVSQRAAIIVSDIMLVPFIPRLFDIWTIEKISNLIEEMSQGNPKLKAYTFLNRTDPRGTDNDDAKERLEENEVVAFWDTPIGNRKAFPNASSQGMAVAELKAQDEKAASEITCLYKHIFDTK